MARRSLETNIRDLKEIESLPAIEQRFLEKFKSKYVPSAQWIPWAYDKDPDDDKLYHPNLKAYRLLFKALKYWYIGGTQETSARWVSYHTREQCGKDYYMSEELFGKFAKQFQVLKGEMLTEARVKKIVEKKQEYEQRTGQTLEAAGNYNHAAQTPVHQEESP